MAILITCIVILLSLAKSNAVSHHHNFSACPLKPKHPKNSLVSCAIDRELDGYIRCSYHCRPGYHFEGRANYVTAKFALCNDSLWLPDPGNCVPPQEEVSTASCLSKPKSPRNSFISCKFRKTLMKYTKCNFICRKGYFFKDGTDEKTSVCRNGSWSPMNYGHYLAGDAKSETLSSTPNSCSSRPRPPLNSFDYCKFDKQAQVYVSCKYYCKRGYHFYSNVSRLTQYCLGGSWKRRRARDCIRKRIQGPPCWQKINGPENSFTYCRVDNNYVGYSKCIYICRTGYYFHGEVYWKARVCLNGEWTPSRIGICVNASERYSNTALKCFEDPLPPRRSSASCVFNTNVGMYTTCNFTCRQGYHFPDMKLVKIQNCVGDRWRPRSIENCISK